MIHDTLPGANGTCWDTSPPTGPLGKIWFDDNDDLYMLITSGKRCYSVNKDSFMEVWHFDIPDPTDLTSQTGGTVAWTQIWRSWNHDDGQATKQNNTNLVANSPAALGNNYNRVRVGFSRGNLPHPSTDGQFMTGQDTDRNRGVSWKGFNSRKNIDVRGNSKNYRYRYMFQAGPFSPGVQ